MGWDIQKGAKSEALHDNKHKCPRCGSTAFYRYGRTRNGKQRYLCLICNRQYVAGRPWVDRSVRPACPTCNAPMHVYRRETDAIRYRCRNYPDCRTFVKLATPIRHSQDQSDHA